MISTHILDLNLGGPASDVMVRLEKFVDGQWQVVEEGQTNEDGRINFNCEKKANTYRLLFSVEEYLQSKNMEPFFTSIPVIFNVTDCNRKYHVPLLLNRFGYSTYRGS